MDSIHIIDASQHTFCTGKEYAHRAITRTGFALLHAHKNFKQIKSAFCVGCVATYVRDKQTRNG